jgi:hypothetical protein
VTDNRLTIDITTKNTSTSDTIQGLHFTPLVLRFPKKVKEYDGSTPLLAHNVGQTAVVPISYEAGTMAVVAEDIKKPLMVGFPWALDKPANTQFPLSVHTNRVTSIRNSPACFHSSSIGLIEDPSGRFFSPSAHRNGPAIRAAGSATRT